MENNQVYYRSMNKPERVGVIYRRISDEYIDPLTFLPESVIGVPNLMSAYRAGNVAIMNAPGNGIADDKGLYYFVPAMVKYYLGEDEISDISNEFNKLEDMLSFFDQIDTSNVEEMIYPFDTPTIYLRDDETSDVISQQDAISNVAKTKQGHVVVPKVVK